MRRRKRASLRSRGATARRPTEQTPAEDNSVLAQLAGFELKLGALLRGFALFARQFLAIAKAPVTYFGRVQYAAPDSLKNALTFMLVGTILSALLLSLGVVLPQSIARNLASGPLSLRSAVEIDAYLDRTERVKATLPVPLAKDWFKQPELVLTTRVVSDETFRLLLQRLKDASTHSPDLLEKAIDGSLTFGNRYGGRRYVAMFFLLLNPAVAAVAQRTYLAVDVGPKYELKPQIAHFVQVVVSWFVSCSLITVSLRGHQEVRETKAAFIIGALLVGVLGPLFQVCTVARNLYLAFSLPAYINHAGGLLASVQVPELNDWSSGVYPFEDLILALMTIGVPTIAFLIVALAAFVVGLSKGCGVPKRTALAASIIGLSIGLGSIELAYTLAELTLAPVGLL